MHENARICTEKKTFQLGLWAKHFFPTLLLSDKLPNRKQLLENTGKILIFFNSSKTIGIITPGCWTFQPNRCNTNKTASEIMSTFLSNCHLQTMQRGDLNNQVIEETTAMTKSPLKRTFFPVLPSKMFFLYTSSHAR